METIVCLNKIIKERKSDAFITLVLLGLTFIYLVLCFFDSLYLCFVVSFSMLSILFYIQTKYLDIMYNMRSLFKDLERGKK